MGSVRQCVSKAGVKEVPFGSQDVVSWTGGGFKVACSCFASLMSLFEWMSDDGYAVVAEFGRVGRLGVEKGAPDVVYPGSRAWKWVQKSDWQVR